MRKVENTKGFKILEISAKEAEQLGFGVPKEGCICCLCNDFINGAMYYIAVLNETMCKDCFDSWIERATYYPEDAPYEEAAYNRVVKMLESGDSIEPQGLQIHIL